MWYLRHMGDNNLKLFLQQWCGRETFQMKYHTIYDMFTNENVLKPIPQWKLVYLNSFQTKYRGSSWFCTSIKLNPYGCYTSRTSGLPHPVSSRGRQLYTCKGHKRYMYYVKYWGPHGPSAPSNTRV